MAGEGFDVLLKFTADTKNAIENVFAFDGKLKDVNKTVEANTNVIKNNTQSVQKLTENTGEVVKKTKDWVKIIETTSTVLKDVANSTMHFISNFTAFGALAVTTRGLGDLTRTLFGVAAGMGVVGLAITTITTLLNNELMKSANEFEKNMANVNSILLQTPENLAAMSTEVLNLAASLGLAKPADMAAALYDISSASFVGADAINILSVAVQAGSAGLTDTKTAGLALTKVLNGLGLSADMVGDSANTLFTLVKRGVLTFQDVAVNIGEVTATSKQLEIDLTTLSAAIAIQTRKGTEASAAFTNYKSLLIAMSTPTTELGKKYDANAIKAKGFVTVVGEMVAAAEKSGNATKFLMDILGRQEALNAALQIGSQNGKEYFDEITKFTESGDSFAAALAEQTKVLDAQINKLKIGIDLLKISFGQAIGNILAQILPFFTTIIGGFNSLGEGTKRTIANITLFLASIIPVVTALGVTAAGIIFLLLNMTALRIGVGLLSMGALKGLPALFMLLAAKIVTAAEAMLGFTARTSVGTLAINAFNSSLKVLQFLMMGGLALAGAAAIFYGISKAVEALKDSTVGWLRSLGELLDKINLIARIKELWDGRNNRKEAAAVEKKEADDLNKSLDTASTLRIKQNRTLAENIALQKALIQLSLAAHKENKQALKDEAYALSDIIKKQRAEIPPVLLTDEQKAERQTFLEKMLDQEAKTKSKYAAAEREAKKQFDKDTKELQGLIDAGVIKGEKEIAKQKLIILKTYNTAILAAVEDRDREINQKAKAAHEKAIADKKKADEAYLRFSEGLAEQKAKINLDAFQKELFDIEKARKEALKNSRNAQDTKDINLVYNAQIKTATTNHLKELQNIKDKAYKEDLARKEQYRKDGLRLEQENYDQEIADQKIALNKLEQQWIDEAKLNEEERERKHQEDLANRKKQLEQIKNLYKGEKALKLIQDEDAEKLKKLINDVKSSANEFNSLAYTLQNSSNLVLNAIGSLAEGIISNVSNAMDAVKAAAEGNFLPLIASIGKEVVHMVDSLSKSWDLYNESLKGGEDSKQKFLESQIELTRAIPFLGEALAGAQRKLYDFFNVTISEKTKQSIEFIKKTIEDGIENLKKLKEQAIADAKELRDLRTANMKDADAKRYKELLDEVEDINNSKKNVDIKNELIMQANDKYHQWVIDRDKKIADQLMKSDNKVTDNTQKNIDEKMKSLVKEKDSELKIIKDVAAARKKDADDALKTVQDTLKEIDKLYQDRIDDQKDKSGLNSLFQQRLGQQRGIIDASITRPNELDFNVGNGLTTGNETERKKIQNDYELGIISFDKMRQGMQEVSLKKYLFYEEEVARVTDPEKKAAADDKRIEAQKEFYQFAEDKEAKALNKKLEGQQKELQIKLSAVATAEQAELAAIANLNNKYQKMALDFGATMEQVMSSLNPAVMNEKTIPISDKQNANVNSLHREAWNTGKVEGKNILKSGQSLEDLRNQMRSGGVNFDNSSSSNNTEKSATGTWDQFGNILTRFAGGGVTNKPSIFGENGPEAAINYPDFKNMYRFVMSAVKGTVSGAVTYMNNNIIINGSPLNQDQLSDVVYNTLNKLSQKSGNVVFS